MGGDARIRWILNNGLEVARKAVKTAGKRHGGGPKDGERTLPQQLGEDRGPLRHVFPPRSWRESLLLY
jgi:hypothetical protein